MGKAQAAEEHTAACGRREGLEGFEEEDMPATELKEMGLLG